jgi:hypothetical protein
VSSFWDFKRNAVWASRSHLQTEHPEITGLPVVQVLNPGPWQMPTAEQLDELDDL